MEKAKHLLTACQLILALQKPVNLHWRRGRVFHCPENGEVRATYRQFDNRHKITIASKGSDYRGDWRELLAHELTHAYVAENHPNAKFHGKTFQRTAAALRRSLRDWGYNLRPLYLKGVDT